MSLDLKAIAEQLARPASPDDLVTWSAGIWATPESELAVIAEGLEGTLADDDRDPHERAAAAHLLEAVELALNGQVPPVELLRAAGLAIAAIPRADMTAADVRATLHAFANDCAAAPGLRDAAIRAIDRLDRAPDAPLTPAMRQLADTIAATNER
jgi:hypothetical protein